VPDTREGVIKSRERKGWEEIGKNKKKREKRQA